MSPLCNLCGHEVPHAFCDACIRAQLKTYAQAVEDVAKWLRDGLEVKIEANRSGLVSVKIGTEAAQEAVNAALRGAAEMLRDGSWRQP